MDMQRIKEFKDKLNANMAKVERCEVLAEKCREGKIGFLTPDNKGIELDGVLNEGQMQTIANMAIIAIESNAKDAKNWLERIISFNPEEPRKQFADGLDIEEEEVEEAPEPKKEVVLDKDQIKEMVQKGMTQKDIAEELGASQGKVQRFIAKNNLQKKKASTPSKNK